MTTEDSFQAALDLNPDDSQTRLVFADYLQEINDPRAGGYRALGVNQFYPSYLYRRFPGKWVFGNWLNVAWRYEDEFRHCNLPPDWFYDIKRLVPIGNLQPLSKVYAVDYWLYGDSRKAVEDTVAHVFTQLHQNLQEELLTSKTRQRMYP